MDALIAPFLNVVLGSFVVVVALLMSLIFVDSLRQQRERAGAAAASLSVRDDAQPTPSLSQPAKASPRRREFALPPERAKAA
ncbi:MAG: hypothetical protein QJR02_00590 [Sinobacteraceae bacterium]|nr:hypothetical protein [Nevskiaceae bacterium]